MSKFKDSMFDWQAEPIATEDKNEKKNKKAKDTDKDKGKDAEDKTEDGSETAKDDLEIETNAKVEIISNE